MSGFIQTDENNTAQACPLDLYHLPTYLTQLTSTSYSPFYTNMLSVEKE